MALNFPGPYEVRIFYTVTVGTVALEHTQRLNCDLTATPTPGDEFSDITVRRRGVIGGGTSSTVLNLAVDDYVTLMRPLFNATSANIDRAELWSYTPGTFEAAFVSAYNIDLAGSSAVAATPAGEVIYTFRTIEGGIMKLVFEEASFPAGQAASLGTITGAFANMRDFILSADNWILARDTSYPFAGYRFNPGSNEAIFKKRYRNI